MDINAFHIYWSPSKKERNFKAYFILTAILSALEWKKNQQGKLTFYADRYTMNFFEKNKLCDFWDKCDNETLDREIDPKRFDANTFYAIGKFNALKHEMAPCAMIDIDLVIWKNIDEILKNNVGVFSHYEKTTPSSIWYPTKEGIQIPKGYQFSNDWDFEDFALNTSFIYFNDEELKNYFVEQAMRYMENNFITSKRDNIGNPEILFVEQRLLRMCYKDMGVLDKCSPLIDVVWGANEGEFLNPEHRSWDFYNFDNNDIATHTWIAKQAIEKNELYQNYMCVRLIEKILELDYRYYDVLKNVEAVKPYVRLLDEYSDGEGLVKNKKASKVLYKK